MCFVCAPQTSSNACALSILFWGAAAPRFGGISALSMKREQIRLIGRQWLLILIVVREFVVVFCVRE
jgi:hypothetical protein